MHCGYRREGHGANFGAKDLALSVEGSYRRQYAQCHYFFRGTENMIAVTTTVPKEMLNLTHKSFVNVRLAFVIGRNLRGLNLYRHIAQFGQPYLKQLSSHVIHEVASHETDACNNSWKYWD